MERKQFTFYRSYWEALCTLPKKDRLAAYEAIVTYALSGEEPEVSGAAATAFILVRPTLDTAVKRARSIASAKARRQAFEEETAEAETARPERSVIYYPNPML